jgi:sialate O-acetylesterase
LAAIISDGAVFQQNRAIEIFGTADRGARIIVRLSTYEVRSDADEYGAWRARFSALPPGGPFTLKVETGNQVQERTVWIGDVWLCSGQSNMSIRVMETADAPTLLSDPPSELLHLLRIPFKRRNVPTDEFTGEWFQATPETALRYSAVCYFFGNALAKALGIPVGLIDTSYPGTRAEAWMPAEAFETSIFLSCERERYNRQISDWQRAHTGGFLASSLYNGMVHPLRRFPVKGVVWYQGEGNTVDARSYRETLAALIHGWRRAWGDEFAFLLVQLPGFGTPTDGLLDNGWSLLREAQHHVSTHEPLTALVNALDLGSQDLHPTRKAEIGYRAAMEARRLLYRESGTTFPRLIRSQTTGDSIDLIFDRPLRTTQPQQTLGIYIAGADRVWHLAEAEVDGAVVRVRNPKVPNPVAARYAWAPHPVPRLFGNRGLPAFPFRTDDWPVKANAGAVDTDCAVDYGHPGGP